MSTTNKPHETSASHETETHPGAKTTSNAPDAPPKGTLMEGTGGIKVARFTVNGQVKSLNLPVTGAELHRVAGNPAKLTMGGKAVANDTEALEIADGADITASY